MTPATFLSFFLIIVGLPVLCLFATIMFKHWLKYKETATAALNQQTAERAAQYAAKVERLEQRMAVMERILTDRSTQLGDEIERLRDTPIN
jgi:hypothetical protein